MDTAFPHATFKLMNQVSGSCLSACTSMHHKHSYGECWNSSLSRASVHIFARTALFNFSELNFEVVDLDVWLVGLASSESQIRCVVVQNLVTC